MQSLSGRRYLGLSIGSKKAVQGLAGQRLDRRILLNGKHLYLLGNFRQNISAHKRLANPGPAAANTSPACGHQDHVTPHCLSYSACQGAPITTIRI